MDSSGPAWGGMVQTGNGQGPLSPSWFPHGISGLSSFLSPNLVGYQGTGGRPCLDSKTLLSPTQGLAAASSFPGNQDR